MRIMHYARVRRRDVASDLIEKEREREIEGGGKAWLCIIIWYYNIISMRHLNGAIRVQLSRPRNFDVARCTLRCPFGAEY